ncbi:MAG: rod shape-determining protein MreD [Bacteroidales bacterium]|nr:rod shape-determining protein MreD [Bacteroidales bacterium]HOY38523.1 rod shape-determining protein MreD [Bacteroidales bacterium]HQP03102.1 rod shape-determining protein MreD [Bacteroidales bacterium]
MINSNLKYFFLFIICIALQVLLFNQIQSIPYTHVFFYILFILLLPIETPPFLLMLLAMATGLVVDSFSNTFGIHAAASVLTAYIRPGMLRLYSPRDGYETNTHIGIRDLGFLWFLKYAASLVIIHHFLLFMLDAFSFKMFQFTLLRITLSSISTISVLILSQYLTIRRR